jgi:sulfhydrogenase subunit beta (sulfur reductase)
MTVGEKYIVDKKQFLDLLISLKSDYDIIGPKKMPDGEVTFDEISSTDEITFEYVNEYEPLKRFLTPTREKLFQFSGQKNNLNLTPPKDINPFILFGVRSCDVQGFAHQDGFFSGAYEDNYYWARRNKMVVISMACNEPLDTCFCICCNGGPWLDSGFDLQLTDFGDRFLVDVGTQKGIDILSKTTTNKATAKDEDLRRQLMQACDEKMVPVAYLAKAIIQISNNRVKEELWEQFGAECFSCGGCTHVCPLCTCYDVQDSMTDENNGVRFRFWDSCQYCGFTHEASGHNPRGQTKERVKRRFYHKLSYAYINQDGHPGCVGCGRCITVCEAFGLLDMAAVVKRIRHDGYMEKQTDNAQAQS